MKETKEMREEASDSRRRKGWACGKVGTSGKQERELKGSLGLYLSTARHPLELALNHNRQLILKG